MDVVVGDRSAALAGMESKRMDADPVRDEQLEQLGERSPMPQQLEKMQRELQTELPSENANSTATSAEIIALEEVDCAATVEDRQGPTSRLLQLSCKFDSTTSLSSVLEGMPADVLDDSGKTALHYAAEQHAVRCIEFLLKRRAKPDIKSPDGLTALEFALHSEGMQKISWSPADKIAELLTLIREKDLTAIKILANHTRDLAEVASRLIVHGNIVAFAALLSVAGDAITSTSVLISEEHGDGTLFDVLLKKAISTGEQVQDRDTNSNQCHPSHTKYNLRQILLKELALFLRWSIDHDQSRDNRHRTPPTSSIPSPLLRAAQAGDVDIVGILIEHEADVNETDSGGNTALHWSLRATANSRDIRVVLKLLRHGASITMGDRLGLTPVHIAAGHGHLQALQILLAVEPSSVDVTAETRETPLFSAVKGNHYECVRVLLQHGASRQVLNLRKQRPIDVAETSDMRAILYLQESSGRVKDLNSIRPPGMPSFDGSYARYDNDTQLLRSQNGTYSLIEYPHEWLATTTIPSLCMCCLCSPSDGRSAEIWQEVVNSVLNRDSCGRHRKCVKHLHRGQRHIIAEAEGFSSNPPVAEKTEMCRYFSMPGGCVRGDKCFYAHREEELQGRPRLSTEETKEPVPINSCTAPTKRVWEDLSKKIFVGGLSPSVESDDLREFFEGKFGPVVDAIVIGSHTGDHVQSRGFGFVTFKNEESVIAAVQAHYVNIFGKKVEIKGAVPRSVLPSLEYVKGALEIFSRPSSAESTKVSEIDVTQVHDMSSLELLCQAKGDLQGQLMNYMGQHGEQVTTQLQSVVSSASPRSPCATSQDVTWVTKFKTWLPGFLVEVSNRLKEGEWYPLSSLKGDFRATCGLELDHLGIGYHKLSDFVRSIPESCRMKIVPVGRGPATHMVLLPALSRVTPPVTAQKPKSIGLTTCSALVDVGRSYADAACELPGKSAMESSVNSRSLMSPPSLVGNSACQIESPNVYNSNAPLTGSTLSRYEEGRLSDNFFPQNHPALVDTAVGHALRPSIAQDKFGVPGSLMQEAEPNNLRDLLALMDSCEGQHVEDRVAKMGTDYLNTNHSISAGPTFIAQTRGAMAISPDSHIDSRQDDPKTPVHQVSLRPFSTFNHPFTGFLPQDYVNTYSMWGRHLGQKGQTNQTIANHKPIAMKNADHLRPGDNSPQSILHPYSCTYAQIGSQEAPRSLFSPAGNSPMDDRPWAALCVYCCERQSVWVAIPCNHYALCAICRDALRKLNRSTANCPVCASHVERWIALH